MFANSQSVCRNTKEPKTTFKTFASQSPCLFTDNEKENIH